MNTEGAAHAISTPLVIEIDSHSLSISQLSRLLRVLQTAIREVAREAEPFQHLFEQQPSPILLLSTEIVDSRLRLSISFAEPGDSSPMPDLSAQAFEFFIERFAKLLEDTTQLGLWGQMMGGVGPGQFDSGVDRRFSELRTELRHFRSAHVSFDGRSIVFEDDQLRID